MRCWPRTVIPAHVTSPRRTHMHSTPWNLDQTRLLTRRELAAVLSDHANKASRSENSWRNLIIVRLSCCCGLRVSEIAGLQLDDVIVEVSRPYLRLRSETDQRAQATAGAAVVGFRNIG